MSGSMNERKCISDPHLETDPDRPDLTLAELRSFAMIQEKSKCASSEDSKDQKHQTDDFPGAEWDEPFACYLEQLLTDNLLATFRGAIKKIIGCGYNMEDAERAVLNIGQLLRSNKDSVPNIVDGALFLLKTERELDMRKVSSIFEGLESLVDYKVLEMIHVVLEVKPHVTIIEAMWCVLISDFNLLNACAVEGGPRGGYHNGKVSGDSSEFSQFKFQNRDTSHLVSNRLELTGSGEESYLSLQKQKGKFSGICNKHIPKKSQATVQGKKGSSSNSMQHILRQKPSDFEKSLKGRLCKGALELEVATGGSILLDKSPKSKGGSSTRPKKGTDSSGSSSSIVRSSDSQSAVYAVNSRSPGSSVVTDPNPKFIDESLKKCDSRDEEVETKMKLVAHKRVLEKKNQGWAHWANDKVMQATQRLGKDLAEMKKLRQEREEAEKVKKDRKTLEENAIKRLIELENALSISTGQIDVAKSTLFRIEKENSLLKKEREAVQLQETASITKLHDAEEREEESRRKCQLVDPEMGSLQEKLRNLKGKSSELDSSFAKAKARQDQFKDLQKKEEEEIARAAAQIEALRKEREEEEVSTNAEAKKMKQAAETDMLKCKEDIRKLEQMIMELRMESDKSRTAALRVGYGENRAKRLPVFQDNFGGGRLPPERECVMCMEKEISVVFLPCAHQVLCGECSEFHEKKGKNDCPTCRATIQKRITVSYNVQ